RRRRCPPVSSPLVEDALRDCEGAVRRGHAAVDGALQQHFLQVVRRDAVPQRRAHVQLELVLAAERDERRDRYQAPRPPVEPGPAPDLAPGVACDQILEVGGELGGALDRTVDVLVAEDFPPRAHPLVAHVRASTNTSLNASACSTLARCAASDNTTRRACGMPTAISSACSGVVTGSSAPATRSVGAPISDSRSRKPQAPIASQQRA